MSLLLCCLFSGVYIYMYDYMGGVCVFIYLFITYLFGSLYIANTPSCPGFDPKDRKWDPERLLLGAAGALGPHTWCGL